MKRSLSRHERLASSREIRKVFREGRKFGGRGMRLHIRPNGLMYNRIVVIPAKGFPNAVQRNLCRRHGKEAYRAQKEQLQCGYDLAIVCFPGEFSFAERLSQLSRLIEKADLTRA